MRSTKKPIFYLILFAYAAVMIYLMLLMRTSSGYHGLSLVPFKSIKYFAEQFVIGIRTWTYSLIFSSVANLAGNIVMFIPLGLLFPRIWQKQRSFIVFLITVILVISSMEAIQYFTCLGTADIDDLFLNVIGATIGFIWNRHIR